MSTIAIGWFSFIYRHSVALVTIYWTRLQNSWRRSNLEVVMNNDVLLLFTWLNYPMWRFPSVAFNWPTPFSHAVFRRSDLKQMSITPVLSSESASSQRPLSNKTTQRRTALQDICAI